MRFWIVKFWVLLTTHDTADSWTRLISPHSDDIRNSTRFERRTPQSGNKQPLSVHHSKHDVCQKYRIRSTRSIVDSRTVQIASDFLGGCQPSTNRRPSATRPGQHQYNKHARCHVMHTLVLPRFPTSTTSTRASARFWFDNRVHQASASSHSNQSLLRAVVSAFAWQPCPDIPLTPSLCRRVEAAALSPLLPICLMCSARHSQHPLHHHHHLS